MFERLVLEPEQVMLLLALVEAHRSVPSPLRMKFMTHHPLGADARAVVNHPGLPDGFRAHESDLEILAREGLLISGSAHGTRTWAVTPSGFRYYEHVRALDGKATEAVQAVSRDYVNSEHFRTSYPEAFSKWSQAETLLWSTDSAAELTTIGHLCREALQAFATTLIAIHKPPTPDPDKAHTVARLRSVLATMRPASPSLSAFLDALFAYWGTLSDLVQKQEHDSQKDNAPLTWEDARRVVLHSLLVMHEVDITLSRKTAA